MAKKSAAKSAADRRAKIAALEAEQKAKKRVKTIIIVVVSLLLATIIGVIIFVALQNSAKPDPTNPSGETIPAQVDNSQYQIVFGSGATIVDVYFDFMCPGCGSVERTIGEDLAKMAAEDQITLRMHPLSFLDSLSQETRYSTRAANAFITVAMNEPDKALDFAQMLWNDQPEENSTGLSDEYLVSDAQYVGVSAETTDKFAALEYEDWIVASTEESFTSGGIESTPGLKINGVLIAGKSEEPYKLDLQTPGIVVEALEQVIAGKTIEQVIAEAAGE
ncbi:MAG: thioredoxin domain-containing protein [Propionibacteriaceae bacterium]|jgi:protein-disulfide isomerase|nr:thioredoxin domain-containing protein [Propionibacteriaceae bacterium]